LRQRERISTERDWFRLKTITFWVFISVSLAVSRRGLAKCVELEIKIKMKQSTSGPIRAV
jgi:hypothetical protein